MMKKLKPTIVLTAICLIVALLLSVVNMFTSPVIKAREDKKAQESLLKVLPDGSDFRPITLDESYPAAVKEGYSANGGFVFRTVGGGRNGDVVVMVGINSDGQIVGTEIISESESKGYKEKIFSIVTGTDGKYKGQTLDTFAPVIAGGATLSSNGFADAIKAALQAFTIANGGSVDTRTPEQILQDNCNLALGTEGKTFTKWFATEVLDGIDAVYETEEGRVYKIGDRLVGSKSGGIVNAVVDGEIVDTTAEDAKVLDAESLIVGSTLTEIAKPEGASKYVSKIYATASGNLVFDLVADGYQSLFEYGSGEKIYITVSISADGKIIDVVTTKHSESKGYGDACATDEYTGAFKGASDADVNLSVSVPDYTLDQIPAGTEGIGIIASATYTTYGYQRAIKAAFAAYEILKGEE